MDKGFSFLNTRFAGSAPKGFGDAYQFAGFYLANFQYFMFSQNPAFYQMKYSYLTLKRMSGVPVSNCLTVSYNGEKKERRVPIKPIKPYSYHRQALKKSKIIKKKNKSVFAVLGSWWKIQGKESTLSSMRKAAEFWFKRKLERTSSGLKPHYSGAREQRPSSSPPCSYTRSTASLTGKAW